METVLLETVLHIINDCIIDANQEDSSDNLKKIDAAQANDDLRTLGVDSILFIQIIVKLEEKFKCEIPDSKLMITEMNTVQKMIEVLQSLHGKQLM